MFFIVLSWLLTFASADTTNILIVKPGQSRLMAPQDWQQYRSRDITIQCKDELKCRVAYEYVGKKYSLQMPNGKNYAYYKDKEKALAKGSQLVESKICDRLELEVESQEIVE